ncbi:MAG TPA: peptide-methionine (S)-S-oxide reductase MsrA, partial [Gemmatimonadales bacterium]
TAVFAGGCFWCIEAVFERLKGVERVVSGYTGGTVAHPTYEAVCMGTTGHAEALQVTFDPEVISYRDLTEIFFAFHDPTTLNRQGPDTGTQYRSAIFYRDQEQARTAREVIAELERERVFGARIVTEVVPLETFYPAEDYHQGYFTRNPERMYCQAMIAPKVAKLRKGWSSRFRETAGTAPARP